MYRLTAAIEIAGSRRWKLDKVTAVEIERDMSKLTGECRLTLPKKIRWDGATEIPVQRGDAVSVNLQANQGSCWGMVAYPRVGSYVVVGFVADGQAGVVLLTDDIESIEAVTDTSRALMNDSGITLSVGTDTTLSLTPDGITLNGGTLGGLAVCSKIRSNLEMLQRYVETLRSAIGSGLNAVGAGTAANGATGAGVFDSAMAGAPALNFEDMDNSKVKH